VTTNKKPMLSVLVDEEKRTQFSQLCARNGHPMAWAINAFITRCLEQDSIETVLASTPTVAADAEGLAELREMIAALGQDLKRVETYTLHSALREGNEALSQRQR
jgi:hypothetical protein